MCPRTALALAIVVLAGGPAGARRPKPPTRVLVVRHGQDTDNARRILNGRRQGALTALGRLQARKAARRLRGQHIDAVYASPLRRTVQTASILRRELGLDKVALEPRLAERDFGVLTGKPVELIPKLASQVLRIGDVDYFLRAKGAETFPQAYRRARSLLADLRRQHPGQTIAVVTHGDLGKMLIAAARGWGWKKGLRAANLHNAEVVEVQIGGRGGR